MNFGDREQSMRNRVIINDIDVILFIIMLSLLFILLLFHMGGYTFISRHRGLMITPDIVGAFVAVAVTLASP